MDRPPAIFMPYPLDEYLDSLPGDYGKIARRLLRAARWTRGVVDGFELDAGEALIDERSEKLWGGLRLDREVSPAGRRALVRRVLERLERDEILTRRAAHAFGPANGPRNGPRNGPSPTVVRFLKFREILWPASTETAQGSAQGSTQNSAQRNGPILPVSPPDPPVPAAAAAARDDGFPKLEQLADALSERWSVTVVLPRRRERDELEAAVAKLGVEAALAECVDDAGTAFKARRIAEPPTSLGFFADRLRRAAQSGRTVAGAA